MESLPFLPARLRAARVPRSLLLEESGSLPTLPASEPTFNGPQTLAASATMFNRF
jgi:hypothetical protein